MTALRCARACLGHRHRGREDSDARESVDRLRAARVDRLRAGLKAQANVARHSEAGPSVGEPSRRAGGQLEAPTCRQTPRHTGRVLDTGRIKRRRRLRSRHAHEREPHLGARFQLSARRQAMASHGLPTSWPYFIDALKRPPR